MSWIWQDDACWQSCSAEAAARAQGWLKDRHVLLDKLKELAGQQPLVSSASKADMLAWRAHATELWSKSEQLVVVGTGGASLGAQALCAMAEHPNRVRFFENCDPATAEHFGRLPVEDTAWCIVSKSGETVETLAAALSLVGHYSHAPSLLRERLVVIVGDAKSTLGQLAASQGWTILAHPKVGGRFSVFSVVGLFPAAYAGLHIEAVHAAAVQAWHADEALLGQAAWLAANVREKPIHVIMAYADRLRASTQWYKQLWAESLGKDTSGSTLVTAIGSIDQHSQLQLYLDGPRDKLMTLWLPDVADQGAPLPSLGIAGLEYLSGHRMGEVMQATAEATATTLTQSGAPLRVVRGKLDAPSLAAWMARQMMETLAVALLLGVDPYSQPAVEEGKKLTRAALARAS